MGQSAGSYWNCNLAFKTLYVCVCAGNEGREKGEREERKQAGKRVKQ